MKKSFSDELISQVEPKELDQLKLWEKIEEKKTHTKISETELNRLIDDIFSSDFELRSQAINELNRLDQVAVKFIVDALVKNPMDSSITFRLTYVLEEIGKKAIPYLLESLQKINQIKTLVDLSNLENITETLIRLNDRSSVPILLRYLDQVKQQLKELQQTTGELSVFMKAPSENQMKKMEFYEVVRLKIHTLLGEMDAKDALDDLLLLLGDGTKRIHVDIIETLAKIGDSRALVPLLRLYLIEQNISEMSARFIKFAFREIVRREKIDKNHEIFKTLSSEEKDILDKIFPRSGSSCPADKTKLEEGIRKEKI